MGTLAVDVDLVEDREGDPEACLPEGREAHQTMEGSSQATLRGGFRVPVPSYRLHLPPAHSSRLGPDKVTARPGQASYLALPIKPPYHTHTTPTP